MSDLLITAAWWLLGAGLCALLVAVLRDSTEGAIPRYLQARRYHRTGARHVLVAAAPASLSVPETAPDAPADDTCPWAVPAVLATIPDPLTIGGAA